MNPRGNFTAEPAYYNRYRNRSWKLITTGLVGIATGLALSSQMPPYAWQNLALAFESGNQWTHELVKAISTGQMSPSLEMVKLICQTPMCWASGLVGAGMMTINKFVKKMRGK